MSIHEGYPKWIAFTYYIYHGHSQNQVEMMFSSETNHIFACRCYKCRCNACKPPKLHMFQRFNHYNLLVLVSDEDKDYTHILITLKSRTSCITHIHTSIILQLQNSVLWKKALSRLFQM